MKRKGTTRRPAERARSAANERFRSIVVPIDLTPTSDRVVRRLSMLPLDDDATVTLLHVVPSSLPPAERRRAVRDAGRALAEEERHLRALLPRSVRIERQVTPGGAAREIGACALRAKAELIVMGRGGGRALREAFLGSTAERVIRKARLPVLVVGRPPRSPYRRPALALDRDRAANEVVRLMLLLIPPPRPPVSVIHAFGIPYSSLIYDSLSDEEILEMQDVFRRRASDELTELLEAGLAGANAAAAAAPSWKIHVRYGSPRVVVGNVIRNIDADLLMLGTRGYSGAAYAFVGTVAGDLLRKADCDVVVVPPRHSRTSRRRSLQAGA